MKRPIYTHLYAQVLLAIACGVLVGHFHSEDGASLKPLGDGFIKLIKMMIAPIIFCTVVTGIAGMEDMKKVGRVGLKSLLYFEAVSTLALVIGLAVVNTTEPGAGMNVDVATLDTKALASYTSAAKSQSTVDFLLNVIPNTIVDAFARGEILQVLLFSLLFGLALASSGEPGRPVVSFIEKVSHALFLVVGFIMKLAPIGAFGAMAFTIGKYGIGSLKQLAAPMGSFYLTCLLFIFIRLGLIPRGAGFSIVRFILYIQGERLDVLPTLSSVPAIPVAGLALILGIDRFMSEARALTNLIGNGVATIVISKWEKELDHDQMQRGLARDVETELDEEAHLKLAPEAKASG